MVRVMDYNDIYWKQDPSHPSDIIPAALACGERRGKDGRELIVGIVLGHEFEMRLCEAAFPGIRERGWHHATLTAFVSPIVAGAHARPGLGEDAARHRHLRLAHGHARRRHRRQADHDEEHRRSRMATQSGVLAALLAEKGYTGPEHVIDGKEGLVHCMGPEWKLEILDEGLGDGWRITAVRDEGLPHRGADPRADLRARWTWSRSNDLQAGRGRRRSTSARWPGPRTSWPTRPSTTRAPRRPPTTACPT